MNITSSATTLTRFRDELYPCFGMRCDAQFDVLDAVTTAPQGESLVGLSLAPSFQRGWASTCDALSDGSLDVPAIQRVLVRHLAAVPPACGDRELWALDGSSWPRPSAPTSPQRTACRVLVPGSAGHTMADGWEYQWLVAVPEDAGSWVLPLAVDRRSPTAGTPTQLAIAQVRAVQAARAAARDAAGTPADAAVLRPILLLDSSYAVGQLVAADLGVDILARLAANRVFRRSAPPWKGIGRLPKHGAPFVLADPATHGEPDVTTVLPDPTHGPITIARWDRLHDARQAGVELSVIRIQHARYAPQAHRSGAPKPLWLVWAAVAGLGRGGVAAGGCLVPGLVRPPLCHRARLPLPETDPGLDHPARACSAGGGPLELATGPGPVAAVVGALGGRPGAPALGPSPAHPAEDAGAR